MGAIGQTVPQVDAEVALQRYRSLNRAQKAGLVASCHDLSDGGLGVALAEKAFAGGFGIRADLRQVPAEECGRDDILLFSESQSRLLVTVRPANKDRFEEIFAGQGFALIGEVIENPVLEITGCGGQVVLQADIQALKASWQAPLKEL